MALNEPSVVICFNRYKEWLNRKFRNVFEKCLQNKNNKNNKNNNF